MNLFSKYMFFVVLLQIFTQSVSSEKATHLNPTDTKNEKGSDNRRAGGILILDNSAKASDGHRVSSQKVETKTYTSHVSTSGSAGSGGLQGWVSQSQNEGNLVLQPQVHGIVRSQQGCGSGDNILNNIGGQSSIVQKKSTIEKTHTFNDGGIIDSLASNDNQWQSGLKGLKVGSVMVGHVGGQSPILHGSSSQATSNTVNDITGTVITNNNQEVNTVYEAINNNQRGSNVLFPDNDSYKVSVVASGDGIYANELTGQRAQSLNVMTPTETNSGNIVAVPVTRPNGRETVQEYRPNMQYYLKEIENSNMLKNPSTLPRPPSFIEHIKPDQMNIHLSEDQLNSYKQYLIQTGLINLKPYQLIFNDQFKPQLRTLQWMAVPVDSNSEYCKQRCGGIFPRDTLYSTISENVSKLPLKLLVPVLRVQSGLKKTLSGVRTITGGVGDISNGVFRMVKDSPSLVTGLVKDNADKTKTQNVGTEESAQQA